MNLKEYLKQSKLFKIFINEETNKDDSIEDIPNELSFLYKEDESELLLQATASLFSKPYPLSRNLFERPTDYIPEYLPCHLRDDYWLANVMKLNPVLNNIDINNILEFIKTSEIFNEARYVYERRIVERQINNMLYADNFITTNDEYYRKQLNSSPNCDIIFRKCVIDTLTTIGIRQTTIESILEKNFTWKLLYMERAFRNRYEPSSYLIGAKKVSLAKKEHREKWMKLRMYEYYQIHKLSVDKSGHLSDRINFTVQELLELTKEVNKLSYERITEIEQARTKENKSSSINYHKDNIKDKLKEFDETFKIDEGIYLCKDIRYYKASCETYQAAYIVYENGKVYYFDTVITDSIFNKEKIGHFLYTKDYVFKYGPNPKIFDIKNKRIIDDIEKFREISASDISRIAKIKIKK